MLKSSFIFTNLLMNIFFYFTLAYLMVKLKLDFELDLFAKINK